MESNKKVDGVFEGGGVNGIGLVGAVSVLEESGYEFVNVAGTSAGAIVAALVGAGYSAAEMKKIIANLDFRALTDARWTGHIPVLGGVLDEFLYKGLYKGDALLNLMRDLLSQKGIRTFRDLICPDASEERFRFKIRMIASDVSLGQMLVLPQDIQAYGVAPEDLEVALAIRMSMSIPFFFQPIKMKNSYIVDGGLLSNFPVEIFDSDGPPQWPTFGIKLVCDDEIDPKSLVRHPIHGPFSELFALFWTAMEAHNAYYLKNDKFVRTIPVETHHISSIDFNLSPESKEELYQSGRQAATDFLARWNFEAYKLLYRSGLPSPTRTQQILL